MLAWPQAGAMKGFEIAWKTGRASIRVEWASRAGKPVSETSRMGLVDEAERRGNRDVGVTDAAVELVWCRPLLTIGLQHSQNSFDLCTAAPDPEVRDFLVQSQCVEQADRLVAQPGRKGRDLQRLMARRFGRRKHPSVGRNQAVEVVEHQMALDQHLAIVSSPSIGTL